MAKDDTEFELGTDDDTCPDSDQAEEIPRLARGTSVGRYVVIDFVDAGGMGAIYQAFDPELNRPVALKILTVKKERSQDSLAAERAKTRMLREAQALAQLTHPNVVTVYDVGEYQDSIFIAMEFVEGSDLLDWQKKNHPSRQEMLAKVIDAGLGLAAAHKVGIVHRDFKPGNVIVGNDGRVRVLDFGLARAAMTSEEIDSVREAREMPSTSSKSLSESSMDLLTSSLTQEGAVVGTTNYMAPEQMDGKFVDERSDQFSFCITLYESLYGCRPFAGLNVRHLFRSIKSSTLQRPQDKKIPKWLDDLVLRGLSFNSADRFASMNDLLEALQSDPAILHKELREKRKRMITVIGSISLSLLIAGFGMWYATTNASRLCMGAEKKLLGVWDPEVKAKVKKAFLGTKRYYAANSYQRVAKILDDRAAQWTALRTDACLATHDRGEQSERMLDLRMRCLNRKLSEMDALVQLFATRTDAKVLEKAVQATFGLSLLDQCANEEFLTAAMPPPKDAVQKRKVESLRNNLDTVMALEKSGKYQEGLELAMQSLATAKTIDYQPAEVEAMFQLGQLQKRTGKYSDAATTLENCRYLADEINYDEIRAKANNTLIFVVGNKLSRLENVDAFIKSAKAVIARYDYRGEIKANWHNNVGIISVREGKLDQALRHFEKALIIRIKTFGSEHPEVAKSHNNVGIIYYEMGKYDRALEKYMKALELREDAFGPEHPSVANLQNNIGNAFAIKGDYDLALKHLRISLQIRSKTLGAEHPDMAFSLGNIGQILYEMGQYDLALDHYEQALKIQEKAYGAQHPKVVRSRNSIGNVYYQKGEYDRALAYLEQAMKMWGTAHGEEHPNFPEPLCTIGWIRLKRNKYKEAQKYFERVLFLCRTIDCTKEGKDHLAQAQYGLAQVLWKKGKERERAIHLSKQAFDFFKMSRSLQGKNYRKEVESWLESHQLSQ